MATVGVKGLIAIIGATSDLYYTMQAV